jgi:hypothetical protein
MPHCEISSIIFVHGTRDFKTKVKGHIATARFLPLFRALLSDMSIDQDHLDITHIGGI